jgi:hypothetical protein
MAQQHAYNLVILHTPNLQDISDFQTVRNILIGAAPEIRTIIITVNQTVTSELLNIINELPTLIFCPTAIDIPDSMRGTRIIANPRTKDEEIEILARLGFPVPRSMLISQIDDINRVCFEPYVVVKPNRGMQGKDVSLVLTNRLKEFLLIRPDLLKNGVLVQEWINTGANPSSYRVMTVLGEPVYCVKSTGSEERTYQKHRIPESGLPVSSNGHERVITLAYDQDVLKLAAKVHKLLPEIPTMGIDIIRQKDTQKLFVLELNSRGLTWHLSSNYGKMQNAKYHLDRYNQFDALKVISRALITVTKNKAS